MVLGLSDSQMRLQLSDGDLQTQVYLDGDTLIYSSRPGVDLSLPDGLAGQRRPAGPHPVGRLANPAVRRRGAHPDEPEQLHRDHHGPWRQPQPLADQLAAGAAAEHAADHHHHPGLDLHLYVGKARVRAGGADALHRLGQFGHPTAHQRPGRARPALPGHDAHPERAGGAEQGRLSQGAQRSKAVGLPKGDRVQAAG